MKSALGLMLGLLAAATFAAAATPAKPLDVFLITIDTLRADHVQCYGYAGVQTPALDSLAANGIRFAQAFTPSPVTNTSHTTILTGLLPSSHGVTDFAVPLAESHPTLAELLKKQGYKTAAFIGAVILDSKSLAPGLDRGFDFYDNFPQHAASKSRWGRVERRGADVVQHAETWLTAHPTGPHFVWVHLYDPHDPYEPPAPFPQTYDGEIAYADSVLGNFLAYLKQRGWYDNALVIAVADHGEGLGEHHEDTHGIFLYDSTTHVPLIVKLPGKAAAGKVVDPQVRTTDILPTVLTSLGIALPPQLDGEPLQAFFAGEVPSRPAIGETDYPLRFGWAPLKSVRADGFKFIEAPRPEFYDLHADPGELANNYKPGDAAAQKFRDQIAALHAKAPLAAAGTDQKSSEDLKALGYQGAPSATASGTSLPDPKDKIEQQNLLHAAMLASDDGRPADARTALEKVLQLDPKSPTALRQLGEIELKSGDYAKAAVHLKLARETNPDDATVSFQAGQALSKTGDLAGARDALEASLKASPANFPARLLLGEVYLGLKDAKNASDQFEAALLVQPDSVEAQVGAAKAQTASGNFADAVQALTLLAASHPSSPDVFEALSLAYAGLGKKLEADRAAARAAQLRKP